MANDLIRIEELVNNPTPRVPVCLCLDTSGSMGSIENGTTRIAELIEGVKQFFEELMADEIAKYSAEICIVTFDSNANCVVDFGSLERQSVPNFSPSGGTYMGEGVNLALDKLETRKSEYQQKGVDYYQPWLVLMTDGAPNGSPSELSRATSRVVSMVESRKLTVFPIAIGNESDISALQAFSPNRKPLRLRGLKFKDFFSWLSKSISRVSQSTPGEKVEFDMDGFTDWASI